MKILIWNINGIESKDLSPLHKIQADIICFSETKIGSLTHYPTIPALADSHRYVYPHLCQTRLRYSGTCIYARECALRRLPSPDFDREGRVIGLEYEDFVLIHVYTPNSGRQGKRLVYRTQEWDPLFWNFVRESMVPGKKIIVCGDLNIVPTDECIWRPSPKAAGCTIEERRSFWTHLRERNMYLAYLPTKEEDDPTDGLYSFWSPFSNCRAQNKGWLLDHFVVPEHFPIKSYVFYTDIEGSDHCPIAMEF